MTHLAVETDAPESICWNCGIRSDCISGPDLPDEGDFVLCIRCACVSVFNADLSRREPTVDELCQSTMIPELRLIRKAINEVNERHAGKPE